MPRQKLRTSNLAFYFLLIFTFMIFITSIILLPTMIMNSNHDINAINKKNLVEEYNPFGSHVYNVYGSHAFGFNDDTYRNDPTRHESMSSNHPTSDLEHQERHLDQQQDKMNQYNQQNTHDKQNQNNKKCSENSQNNDAALEINRNTDGIAPIWFDTTKVRSVPLKEIRYYGDDILLNNLNKEESLKDSNIDKTKESSNNINEDLENEETLELESDENLKDQVNNENNKDNTQNRDKKEIVKKIMKEIVRHEEKSNIVNGNSQTNNDNNNSSNHTAVSQNSEDNSSSINSINSISKAPSEQTLEPSKNEIIPHSIDDTKYLYKCRYTKHGKIYTADSLGFVCKLFEIDAKTQCCPNAKNHQNSITDKDPFLHKNEIFKFPDHNKEKIESGKRFVCDSCDSERCCNIYEHCVSCCLRDEQNARQKFTTILDQSSENQKLYHLYSKVSTIFEFCQLKCRTNSQSVLHENRYRSENIYCF